MEVKKVPGQKPGSFIWFGEDGLYYHRKPRSVGGCTYYCIWKTKYKCTGKAHSKSDGKDFECVEEHSGREKAMQYHESIRMEHEITKVCLDDLSLEVTRTIQEHLRR